MGRSDAIVQVDSVVGPVICDRSGPERHHAFICPCLSLAKVGLITSRPAVPLHICRPTSDPGTSEGTFAARSPITRRPAQHDSAHTGTNAVGTRQCADSEPTTDRGDASQGLQQ